MRTLIVATAVILSVAAAEAQQMVGEKPAAAEAPAVHAVPPQPPEGTPTPGLVEQLKAAGELKDPKALEAPAPKLDAAAAKPAQIEPTQAKPAEAQAVVAKSSEAPAPETRVVEAKRAPVEPIAKPAKKRVVKKRESDEQKARRIASKYGITW